MPSCGMLRRVSLLRNVSEEFSAFIIRATRIWELGTTLVVTSNRNTKNYFLRCLHRFLKEPNIVRSQKTAFFIVTAVKTSYLT
jgi:hypothetical protein